MSTCVLCPILDIWQVTGRLHKMFLPQTIFVHLGKLHNIFEFHNVTYLAESVFCMFTNLNFSKEHVCSLFLCCYMVSHNVNITESAIFRPSVSVSGFF